MANRLPGTEEPGNLPSILDEILWRRLDAPGHDACRLERNGTGWALEGTAVFAENALPAVLEYQVVVDSAWHTTSGHVHGWLGEQGIDLRVTRARDGNWMLNGAAVPGLEAHVDLDLGFTPATNLLQLRRVSVQEGEVVDLPVAWLDVASATLTSLPQRYERRTATSYWYDAPGVGYRGLLQVRASGFILRYPELWEAEPLK